MPYESLDDIVTKLSNISHARNQNYYFAVKNGRIWVDYYKNQYEEIANYSHCFNYTLDQINQYHGCILCSIMDETAEYAGKAMPKNLYQLLFELYSENDEDDTDEIELDPDEEI